MLVCMLLELLLVSIVAAPRRPVLIVLIGLLRLQLRRYLRLWLQLQPELIRVCVMMRHSMHALSRISMVGGIGYTDCR